MTDKTVNFRVFARARESGFGVVASKTEKLHGAFGKLKAAGIGAAALGVGILGKTIKDSVQGWQDHLKVVNQTSQVVKTMGNQSHISAKQVGALADSIEAKTTVDGDAIQSGENLLLTFGNIKNVAGKGNDVFNQTTQLMTDMSVAMGQSTKASAIQLGKALNDPVKGMTALSKVGVSFTDGQAKMVKHLVATGNTLGAQKVILKAVNQQFAGSAAAQATAAGKMGVAWHSVQDQIGAILLPVFNKLFTFLAKVGLPALSRFIGFIQTHWPAIRAVIVKEWNIVYPYLAKIATWAAKEIRHYWPQISATIGGVLRTVRALIGTAVAIIQVVWKKFGSNILAQARNVFRLISTQIRAAMRTIRGVIDIVLGLIHGDWGRVWKGIKEIFSGQLLAIRGLLRYQLATFRNVISAALKAIVSLFGGLVHRISSALGNLGSTLYHKGSALIQGLWNGATAKWGSFWNWLKGIPGRIGRAALGWATTLIHKGGALIQGLFNGITNKMKGIGGWIKRNVVDPIINWVKHHFGIHSPSTVFHGIGQNMIAGLVRGLAASDPKALVMKVFGSVPKALAHMMGHGISTAIKLPKKALSALRGLGSTYLSSISDGWNKDFWNKVLEPKNKRGGGGDQSAHSSSAGAAQSYARSLLGKFGWGGGEMGALTALWNGESGWNNLAQNKTSSAFGIAQFLDSTWGGFTYPKTSDYKKQVFDGLEYIGGVYGSPTAALGAWMSRSPHWYGNGLTGGVFTKPTLIGVGDKQPERVDVTPLTGGSRASGGRTLTLEIKSGGSSMDNFIAELIRKFVRVNGGNVQTVLGRS